MSLSQREKEQRLSAYIDSLNAGRAQQHGSSEQDEELRSLMDTTLRIRALKDVPLIAQGSRTIDSSQPNEARSKSKSKPYFLIGTAILLAVLAAAAVYLNM